MGYLRIKNIGKAYKHYASKWGRLAEWLSIKKVKHHDIHWVIREIDFCVEPGEAVGIVGKNGAGKSTLLKIITGTTQPTEGVVEKSGRIAALLELGMGFHPDYTGRENVSLAGQLLGFSADETSGNLAQIEDFAEIGRYMDEPVRTYSSGMQVRLAFSVATAIRPDILIVDEALSVGDAYFQHKCFSRIRNFKEQGTTLLFVSHDPAAVRTLCTRAVLLDEGRIVQDGPPQDVLDYYNALIAKQEIASDIKQATNDKGQTQTRSGSGEASVINIQINNSENVPAKVFEVGEKVSLDVSFKVYTPIASVFVGILIKDRLGNDIYGTNSFYDEQVIENALAGEVYKATFVLTLNLGPGTYSISTALVNSNTHLDKNYEWIDRATMFEVVNLKHRYCIGTAYLPTEISVRLSGALKNHEDLNQHKKTVFSQFGEDGIIERIFNIIGVKSKISVEFGAYDGIAMSNTANLIRNHGWSGKFIEHDSEMFNRLKENYAQYPDVQCINSKVSINNVEKLLIELEIPCDFDLLSIDVDGNDYWIWKNIINFKPRVIVIEFNGSYPPPRKWVMAYNEHHVWSGDDYFGASIQSYYELAKSKGYELVCCEENGSNLFFIEQQSFYLFNIPDNDPQLLYNPPKYGMPENNGGHPHREGDHLVI
ncbi:MAG: ABC transporter ATP-binding protein [Sulfuricaulis sp.]